MKRIIVACAFVALVASNAFSQWECPSQLSAYLKPVGNTNLFWSAELTGGAGYLSNNYIANGMGIVGLDWSSEKSTFYVEGGVKYWNRYDLDASHDYSNKHVGVRELYYQYKAAVGSLTLGVQSARLDDDFLLNERVLGGNLRLIGGKWSFNLLGGTVTKDFARNGTFCNVGYLYDIFPDRLRTTLGNHAGQTNLAAMTLKYQPGKSSGIGKTKGDADEFSIEEFSSMDSQSVKKPDGLKLESIGVVLYHEFGSWIDQSFFIGGLFAQTEWGKGWSFKPELLVQSASNNNALIYSLRLEKVFVGETNKTSLNLRYLGFSAIDANAKVLNSFSNVFAGDVIRLDALDLPFIQAGARYSLPKPKIHFKAQFASQLKSDRMKEFDLETGKKFGKNLQVNILSGFVNSKQLVDNTFLGRVEFRYYF